ncbi:MAG: toxin-antitoxin system YwqK family antitoxin [Thiohalocapsa sp.]
MPQPSVTGIDRRHDDDGNLIEEADRVDGELHGRRRIWSAAGTLIAEAHYVHGKLNGKCCLWYDDGMMLVFSYYVDDELHGLYKSYWDNGNLKESGVYIHGSPSEYQWFDDAGNLIEELI